MEKQLKEPFLPKDDNKIVPNHIDAEMVTAALGKYAKYQLFAVALIDWSWYIFAFEVLIMAFIAVPPPFYCQQELSETNISIGIQPNISIYDNQCSFKFDNQTDIQCGINGSHVVYQKEFGETLSSEFDLGCNKGLVELGTSLFMFGSMFTMVTVSQLADRYGRKWVFNISCWIAAGFCFLSAFSPNFTVYLILRFIMGVTSVGLQNVSFAYVCETISPEIRHLVGILGNLIWVIAYMLTGVLAMYFTNWRTLTMVASIPMLITISFHWFLPESLHWLVARNKTEDIKTWIDLASKRNGVKIDVEQCKIVKPEDEEKSKEHLIHIFKSGVLMFHLVLFCYVGITNIIIYWGLTLFSTQMSDDRFTGYFLSGLIELPAGSVGPILLIWFGRRTVGIFSFTLSGVALLSLVFIPPGTPQWITMCLFLLAKFANIMVFCSTFLIMTEMIPTTVRTVYGAIIGTACKIGSVLSPYFSVLAAIDPRLPPGIFGTMSLIAAAVHFCFPETRGIEMPENIDETDPGPVLKYFMKKKNKEIKHGRSISVCKM